ncbi:MAG: 4'-phosphopantetheinyl transferase superfamily protein [Nocardioidaceae bacterium]|nr:4'-phosphopantetheinyl transferase superfamily protein [Nocardioidaceae bacterium]
MTLDALLPGGVVVRGGDLHDPAWSALATAADRAAVGDAVPARVLDFLAGRGAARAALLALGADAGAPLARGLDRSPRWPADVVGSLTHGAGEVAAAVARPADVAALGIDVEPLRPLPTGVAAVVGGDAELRRLEGFVHGPSAGAVVLFSAKESLFKAWHPLHRTWLDLHDADVRLRDDGTFGARLTPASGPRTTWSGRWEVDGDVVRTAVAVAAPG